MLTWFWMRSLTRSMGAAAVFETAAETPPTDKLLVAVASAKLGRQRSHHIQLPMADGLMDLSMEINVLKKSTTKPGIPKRDLSAIWSASSRAIRRCNTHPAVRPTSWMMYGGEIG